MATGLPDTITKDNSAEDVLNYVELNGKVVY